MTNDHKRVKKKVITKRDKYKKDSNTQHRRRVRKIVKKNKNLYGTDRYVVSHTPADVRKSRQVVVPTSYPSTTPEQSFMYKQQAMNQVHRNISNLEDSSFNIDRDIAKLTTREADLREEVAYKRDIKRKLKLRKDKVKHDSEVADKRTKMNRYIMDQQHRIDKMNLDNESEQYKLQVDKQYHDDAISTELLHRRIKVNNEYLPRYYKLKEKKLLARMDDERINGTIRRGEDGKKIKDPSSPGGYKRLPYSDDNPNERYLIEQNLKLRKLRLKNEQDHKRQELNKQIQELNDEIKSLNDPRTKALQDRKTILENTISNLKRTAQIAEHNNKLENTIADLDATVQSSILDSRIKDCELEIKQQSRLDSIHDMEREATNAEEISKANTLRREHELRLRSAREQEELLAKQHREDLAMLPLKVHATEEYKLAYKQLRDKQLERIKALEMQNIQSKLDEEQHKQDIIKAQHGIGDKNIDIKTLRDQIGDAAIASEKLRLQHTFGNKLDKFKRAQRLTLIEMGMPDIIDSGDPATQSIVKTKHDITALEEQQAMINTMKNSNKSLQDLITHVNSKLAEEQQRKEQLEATKEQYLDKIWEHMRQNGREDEFSIFGREDGANRYYYDQLHRDRQKMQELHAEYSILQNKDMIPPDLQGRADDIITKYQNLMTEIEDIHAFQS